MRRTHPPHFNVPTWALNLQTVSCDHYLSQEKISIQHYQVMSTGRKTFIYFSNDSFEIWQLQFWDVQQLLRQEWQSGIFLCITTVLTHFKAAVSISAVWAKIMTVSKKVSQTAIWTIGNFNFDQSTLLACWHLCYQALSTGQFLVTYAVND